MKKLIVGERSSNVKSGENRRIDLETTQSTARQDKRFELSHGSIHFSTSTAIQGTVPKDKGKGILVEEPKKKKLTLQQIRALETTNDEEVARKIQAEWDAEEERKK
ncbi:hypothetical protein Tco_0514775 [Tanacetum coccineum]